MDAEGILAWGILCVNRQEFKTVIFFDIQKGKFRTAA